MRNRWRIVMLTGLCGLAALEPGARTAQGTPSITLGRSVLGTGGGQSSGPTHKLVGTVGQTYVYGPTTLGSSPNRVCSGWWCVELSGVLSGPDRELPKQIAFGKPRPNPSNGNLTLDFTLPRAARVDVCLIDVMGRRTRSLTGDRFEPGEHSMSWDGRDETGHTASAGVYFMRVSVDGREFGKRRVVVVR